MSKTGLSGGLRPADTTPALTKTSPVGGITITASATLGQFVISLASADTRALAPGSYYHEARVTDGTGHMEVVTTGTATLRRSATL